MCILCGLGEKEYMACPVRIFKEKRNIQAFQFFFGRNYSIFCKSHRKESGTDTEKKMVHYG